MEGLTLKTFGISLVRTLRDLRMVLETTAHITPAQTVTYARASASFSRDFIHTRGNVEVVPGETVPRTAMTASVVTSKTGHDTQFWALRTSLSVFHQASGRCITVENALYDLPLGPKTLLSLHNDATWSEPLRDSHDTLSAIFRQATEEATIRGLELADVWQMINASEGQATKDAESELRSISTLLANKMRQAFAHS
jgi:hypothetical protein